MEKPTTVPLSVMVGQGNLFLAQDKEYQIIPLKLKYVSEFLEDQISIGGQLFNLADKDSKDKVEKWIPRVIKHNDKEITLQDLMNHDWDLSDLKRLWKDVLDISG